ncbi:HMG1/2-like protein [Impatiens glandulifera]|uniref:HMG1/2-like protein n=1 Tax=Impatiens glandulifera TaxID=253017 RepID=UPI001FB127BC|nr:HMG1/2-like protein [Impatiens glandulifera]XP_047329226.1 HMG1/2-like protein [Impatiens glandulifera]
MKAGKSKAESKRNDSKLAVKKGGKGSKAGKVKDPNKPKRPPSAFFVFMEEFRPIFKQQHPENKAVSVVGKAGGEKWKSMSESEKVSFVEIAVKRKAEYEKKMEAYNRKLAGGKAEEESDKSRSEVNDEDDAESGDEGDD